MMLDVTGRLIVIIGGGNVAARKCEGLLAAGATRIRVVSPAFSDRLPTAVERISATYDPKHLDGADLVFAATNVSAVNDAVIRDAHARGLLVNRADGSETEPGDFASPAVHRDRAVVVAVSAGGSPVLAARIRDQIAGRIDSDLLLLADALRQIRPSLLADANLTEPQRREKFRRLASDEAIKVLHAGGVAALERWIADEKFAATPAPSAAQHAQSAIRNPNSAIDLSPSAIENRQSKINHA